MEVTLFNLLSEVNTDTFATSLFVVILFVLIAVALVPVAVFLIGKYHTVEKDNTEKVGKLKTVYLMFIVLAFGLFIRLLMTFVTNGYGPDYTTVYNLADDVVNNGFKSFAANNVGMGPLTGYIYALFGAWGIAMGNGQDDIWMQFFVKLPYILADVALFLSIYFVATKYTNKYVALTVSSLYYLSPVSFVMSSMWGSEYAFLALALFYMFFFLLRKNIFGMTVTSVLACLISPDATFIVPIIAVYFVYAFVKSIIKIVKTKPTFDGIFKDNTLYNVFYVPLCLALGLVAIYLLALPAYYPGGKGSFGAVYNMLFVQPFLTSGSLKFFSTNGLSVYNIFTQNYSELGANFPTIWFAVIFVVLIIAVVTIIFVRKRNRANIVILASYASLTVAVYFMGAGAWAIIPSLVLMLLSYLVIKDKRILKVYSLLSVFVTLNAMLVMLGGDQISATLGSGVFEMTKGAYLGFNIALSVCTVLTHIYYTVVALDITLTGRRKEFLTDKSSSFGETINAFVRG